MALRKLKKRKPIRGFQKLAAKRVLKKTATRAFSERREAKAISPMVAHVPFTTAQAAATIDSTAIYSFSYDRKRLLLRITFWKTRMRKGVIKYLGAGSIYWYYKVPEDVFDAFQRASSKGRFFYYFIRSTYKHTRVR